MSAERKHREEIVRYGRMLHERGFVAAMDGNLSVRLDDKRILVTPTCVSKGAMRARDMVIVDLQGRRVAGRRNVTSEIGMHLLIYRTRTDIQAIVHAHPPTATGFAAAGMALTEPLVCEVVMGLGCIPLARYGTPGTSELAKTLEPYVPHYDAILMSESRRGDLRGHDRTRLYEDGDGGTLRADCAGHAPAGPAAAADRG